MRLRFAPSPTGALHIGGVRTALYNYLLAKKHGGTFILRIEDTDQNRYVEGAEKYIIEALEWCGLQLDEGPAVGGDYGPYRQSERKDRYQAAARRLVERGEAYYAFDTPEQLSEARARAESQKSTFKYSHQNRQQLRNSLRMSDAEVQKFIEDDTPYVIRLKVEPDQTVAVRDRIRGTVEFSTNELDDKVLLKADGMPTYHLANVVDDHGMNITHVVRGEEWLPSTAHHVLLYQAFGWEENIPTFAHLPLILKPNGKGKLSKRDGAKLGIPVFPLSWGQPTDDDFFEGFREAGFLPAAVVNFLAFLGWNPGNDRELFTLSELVTAFDIERVSKSGARFDFDKAKWYNQQYIIQTPTDKLVAEVRPWFERAGYQPQPDQLHTIVEMYRERAVLLPDFVMQSLYVFEPVANYDEKTIRKKWKTDRADRFDHLVSQLNQLENFQADRIEQTIKTFMADHELRFGDVLPPLRVALTGVSGGPSLFQIMELLGQPTVINRLKTGFQVFGSIATTTS